MVSGNIPVHSRNCREPCWNHRLESQVLSEHFGVFPRNFSILSYTFLALSRPFPVLSRKSQVLLRKQEVTSKYLSTF